PRSQVRAGLHAVNGDWRAGDELHCHPWPPVVGDTAIQESRNARVLQASQDAALGVESLVLGHRAGLQELDRGMLRETSVAAPRLEDLPHAAAANTAAEPPRPDPLFARRRVAYRLVRGRLGGLRQKAAHGAGGMQQALQLGAQLGVVVVVVMQGMFALLGRQIEQAIQLSVETGWLPLVGVLHRNALAGGRCGGYPV